MSTELDIIFTVWGKNKKKENKTKNKKSYRHMNDIGLISIIYLNKIKLRFLNEGSSYLKRIEIFEMLTSLV